MQLVIILNIAAITAFLLWFVFFRIRLNREIAERKNTQEKLRQSAQEWQKTFDSISDLIFIQDRDFTIIKVNGAFTKAMKLNAEDLIGKKCFEVLHKSDKPWPNCPFAKTKVDFKFHSEEVNDPNIGIPLLVTTSPIFNENGELVGSVHIAKDISHIRKSKEELEKKNAELQKLDQLKSDFVSTVSHELRTPLSITKEGISLVLDEIPGAINPKQSSILQTAKDNIDRLARIINDLLDISKIESGKIELKRDLIDLVDLMSKITAMFKDEAGEKGIELKTDVSKNHINVYADYDKLSQVFTNLISNALKFTKQGRILITAEEKNDIVECTVEDTGIGISKEDIAKVFSKFQQFARAAGPGEKGTGLGLSIVKGIVEMHKGTIEVESELDKGTKFIFTLPKYNVETMFKEYAEMGIQDAKKADSAMSLFIVAINGFDEIRKNISGERLKNILSGLEDSIKKSLRRAGDAVAKDTGEIIVIVSGCGKENVLNVINRLQQNLNDYLVKERLSEQIKLKIGYSTYPQDAETEEELIRIARK